MWRRSFGDTGRRACLKASNIRDALRQMAILVQTSAEHEASRVLPLVADVFYNSKGSIRRPCNEKRADRKGQSSDKPWTRISTNIDLAQYRCPYAEGKPYRLKRLLKNAIYIPCMCSTGLNAPCYKKLEFLKHKPTGTKAIPSQRIFNNRKN